MYGETYNFQCEHQQREQERVLTANLLQNWFSDRVCNVTITDADSRSLKSLHTLFDKYFDPVLVKFEQYRMVWTIQNFELFDKKR